MTRPTSPPGDGIDWSRLSFPSDRVTLGALRQRAHGDAEAVGLLAHNLVTCERDMALSSLVSYASDPEMTRIHSAVMAEKRKELAAMYVESGVASGSNEASVLVEELLAAVAAAAGLKTGRNRR